MKILIHSGFDFNRFSGIGRIIDEMGKALREAGAEVDYLYGRGGPESVYTYLDGYPGQFSVREALDFRWGVRRFQKFISRKKYDIVHSHARWAYHSTRARYLFGGGYKVLTFVHGLPHPLYRDWKEESKKGYTQFPLPKRIKAGAILRKEAFYQKHADAIIVPSRGVQADVLQYLRLPSRVVPYGVDLEKFHPDPEKRVKFRSRHNLKDDEIVCLFVGSPIWRKGLFYLLQALRDHKLDYSLCLVGLSDGERKSVKSKFPRQRIIDYGRIRDIFTLTGVFCGCDLFAFPSLYEGLPMVLLEALSSGLPCLVADCNGAADVIDDGKNGFIVPRRDPPALAARLRELEDHELRIRLAGAARRSVLKFTWDRMARRLLRIYGELIN